MGCWNHWFNDLDVDFRVAPEKHSSPNAFFQWLCADVENLVIEDYLQHSSFLAPPCQSFWWKKTCKFCKCKAGLGRRIQTSKGSLPRLLFVLPGQAQDVGIFPPGLFQCRGVGNAGLVKHAEYLLEFAADVNGIQEGSKSQAGTSSCYTSSWHAGRGNYREDIWSSIGNL